MDLVNEKSGSAEANRRSNSDACVATVRRWTHEFPPEADILQIGFEGGAIPQLIIDAGLRLHLVDASRGRLGIFRQMFPEVRSACSDTPGCTLFNRTFDGVLVNNDIRTMPKEMGAAQLSRIERLLRAGGRLLIIIRPDCRTSVDFRSAPEAISSAKEAFERDLLNLGLHVLPQLHDRSENEYVCATKHVQAGVPH